jgi:biopolymer transport protein TolQ
MYSHSPVFFGELGRSVPALVFESDLFVKSILLALFLLSVISWAIIYDRTRLYLRLRRGARRLQTVLASRGLGSSRDTFKQYLPSIEGALVLEAKRYLENRPAGQSGREVRSAEDSPVGSLKDLLERRAVAEVGEMEKYLVFLATTVSIAPFLGLLGTVWGITDSFLSMGIHGTASIEVVGPGIAEALITTIAGLATAIPAVVGYNLLLRHVRRQEAGIELFISRIVELAGARTPDRGSVERETNYEKNPV